MAGDVFGRKERIDSAVEKAVRGEKKPEAKADPAAAARARVQRGRQRASDSRIHGNLELARKAARDLMQGTMDLNKLKQAQTTDSNN